MTFAHAHKFSTTCDHEYIRMSVRAVECPLCGYWSPTPPRHVSHVRLVHVGDHPFRLECCFPDCNKTFSTAAAFSTHVYRFHRGAMGLSSNLQTDAHQTDHYSLSPSLLAMDQSEDPADDTCTMPEVEGGTPQKSRHSSELNPLERKRKSAKFLLRLTEGHRLTQKAIGDVIDGCRELCVQTALQVKEAAQTILAQSGMDPPLLDVMDTCDDPFQGLSTPYLQHKFFAEHFPYVVSNACLLSCCLDNMPCMHGFWT